MKISVKKDYTTKFEGDEYVIDLDRKFGGYEPGDLIIYGCPFGGISFPLELELAIRKDGKIIFRAWRFGGTSNNYFHTYDSKDKFIATEDQIRTVSGLFSGRIKFEGLKLAIGATIQEICPVDIDKEQEMTGDKIYLA